MEHAANFEHMLHSESVTGTDGPGGLMLTLRRRDEGTRGLRGLRTGTAPIPSPESLVLQPFPS